MVTQNNESRLPPNTHCSQCGAALRCGSIAGDQSCWCATFPRVMPVPKAEDKAGCYCPTCLQERIDEASRNP